LEALDGSDPQSLVSHLAHILNSMFAS